MDFNYIVTIHNSEAQLERVLEGLKSCANSSARVILVVDGCTDGSENIARKFKDTSGLDTRIVLAPDVHEIRSINYGLKEAKPGYCVICQDDVVLQEPDLEKQIVELNQRYGGKLGYISMRLGGDVKGTNLIRRLRQVPRHGFSAIKPLLCVYSLVGHPSEALEVPRIRLGQFLPKMVGIKSPVCLTPALRDCVPLLDEALAPYCYDDVDMSLAALEGGLINGLFPVRFQSELSWGGTRKDPTFSSVAGERIFLRNRRLLWQKYSSFLANYKPTSGLL